MISAQFLDELAGYPAYASVIMSRSEVQQMAVLSFELQLRLIGQMTIPERLAGISSQVGRLRATQGIPLEAVLQAVRTDFRFLWNAILERLPSDQLADFTKEAVRVWEAVEHHSMLVYDGYVKEVRRSSGELEDQRSSALGQLLAGDPERHYTLELAAASMGVGIDSTYIVAIASPSAQAGFRAAAEKARMENSVYVRDNFLGVLLENPAKGEIPSWVRILPCAASPIVTGLANVPKAWRLGCDMLKAARVEPTTMITFRDAWPDVAAWYLEPLGEAFTDLVLGGLKDAPAEERERLFEAVEDYIHTGSTSVTAKRLYRHRNTIINRIDSFSRATSFSPTSPIDSAAILLAMSIHRRSHA